MLFAALVGTFRKESVEFSEEMSDADEGAVETLAVGSLPSGQPAYRTVDAQPCRIDKPKQPEPTAIEASRYAELVTLRTWLHSTQKEA